MFLNGISKLLGVLLALLFITISHAAPLTENDASFLNQTTLINNKEINIVDHPFEEIQRQEKKKALLRDTITRSPIFDQMFDNISEHYITYSKYLETASIKEIIELRVQAMLFYKDAASYASAESKFDNFVVDFRPKSAVFDQFAFGVVDFLMIPGLGVENYSASELARIRSEVISTVPQLASPAQRNSFIAAVDSILTRFPNGKNLGAYFTKI